MAFSTGLLLNAALAMAQQQQPPVKVDVTTPDAHAVWYLDPVWIGIGVVVFLIIIVLAIMAARGRSRTTTTVLR